MTAEENKAIVSRYLDEAWNKRNPAVIDEVSAADLVQHVRATHSGPFRGIPPAGKPLTLTGMATTRMRDGQMVENWNETDDLGMMQQLGVIPPPPPPPGR
jgi:hypothetical protein